MKLLVILFIHNQNIHNQNYYLHYILLTYLLLIVLLGSLGGIIISFFIVLLKETRNSFKMWTLNISWISSKAIIEIRNVTKAAAFKRFLHQSYKNTQLISFATALFNYFHETNINQWFWGLHKNKNCAFPLRFLVYSSHIRLAWLACING